jgi:hypothetical protein
LSIGEHTITFTANDGNGGVITDEITVEVTNERVRQSANDYDGDGEADISIFRPSTGFWWTLRSSDPTNLQARQWGANADRPVAGDYDGDGIGDLVVLRTTEGLWYLLNSSNGTIRYIRIGISTDTPV